MPVEHHQPGVNHVPGSLAELADEWGVHHTTIYRWYRFIKDEQATTISYGENPGNGSGTYIFPTEVEKRQLRAMLLMDSNISSHARKTPPQFNQVRRAVTRAIPATPKRRYVVAFKDGASCFHSLVEAVECMAQAPGVTWLIDLDGTPVVDV